MGYDILIVGGGIVGAGTARDAVMRGLKVAVVEQEDLAYGTSSRSSKLVHGGLRYLQQGEISLVFESVSERRVLLEIAPHLVSPLGFLFPLYKDGKLSPATLNLGMWLYDGLSLFRSPKIHKNHTGKEAGEAEPALAREGLRGAPLYYDCSTDDARLTLETALDAQARGADIFTWTRVTGFVRGPTGRVAGVTVVDRHDGSTRELHASVVINATGPWTDRVRNPAGDRPPLLRTTKGVHVVVARERLPLRHAVVCNHPDDNRVLFAIPWGDRSYIGTTDTDYEGDPADVACTAADVAYLLRCMDRYFPGSKLVPDDIVATWAGLRPLIAGTGSGTASSVSREHEIHVDADGLLTIAGGKLTTYRKMAGELVDRAVAMLRLTAALHTPLSEAYTARQPLPGAVGWPEDDDAARVEKMVHELVEVEDAVAELLVATYGTRAMDLARLIAADPALGEAMTEGRPERMAQVDFAVDRELARTVRDVLIRRTQLFFRDTDQGLLAAPRVAARMQQKLGWSDTRREAEVEAYREEVARSRRWRSEAP
jgi:glycerol-3-phosphate dehydrogenase